MDATANISESSIQQAKLKIDRCKKACSDASSQEARKSLMEAYLEAAALENAGAVDRMKHLFAAQDLATQLFAETADAHYQRIIERCEEDAGAAMTKSANKHLPAFMRKMIARTKKQGKNE